MIYNLGSVEKNNPCFQFQKHMSITDAQYLRSYVQTCSTSMTEI